MSFLAAGWLAALGAAAFPVLLHIIFRRRFAVTDWAATRFLEKVLKRHRRRLAVENLLLLVLRVLVLAVAALVFAAPVMRGGLAARFGHGTGPAVIILDTTLSMTVTDGDTTALDRARQAAADIIRREASRRTTHLLLLDGTAPLTVPGGFDAQPLLAAVAAAPVLYGRTDPAAALESAAGIAAEAAAPAEVFVVTDLQRTTWDIPADTPAGRQLAALAGCAAVDLIDVSAGAPAPNAGILDAAVIGRPPTAGRTGTVGVRLTARSGPTRPVEVAFHLDGARAAWQTVTVKPGETTAAEAVLVFPAAGMVAVEIRLSDDGLAGDNRYYLPVRVRPAVTVLAVNGETSVGAMQDETDFFRKAMNPGGEFPVPGDITINVTEMDEPAFRHADLARYDVVVLANVMRLTAARVRTLEDFALRGGAVIIAAGPLVDREFFNTALYRDGQGLMPCRLGPLVSRDTMSPGFTSLAPASVRGPVLAFMQGFRAGVTDRIHFMRYFAIEPATGDATAAAAFSDGTPAVVTAGVRGCVTFLNFTLDTAWTDFPGHPLYLPFCRELVNYGVNAGDIRSTAVCGVPLAVRVPSEASGREFLLTAPSGNTQRLRPLFAGDDFMVTAPTAAAPGFYRVSGPDFEALRSRNPAAEEGDSRAIGIAELRGRFPGVLFHLVAWDRGPGASGTDRDEAGTRLWRAAAIVLLALVTAECILARVLVR
ncbi:MAG: BatA domain-containing protein [Planctomycetota bacterium]